MGLERQQMQPCSKCCKPHFDITYTVCQKFRFNLFLDLNYQMFDTLNPEFSCQIVFALKTVVCKVLELNKGFAITFVKHYIPPRSSCRNILFEVNVRKNYYSLFLPKHGQNIISKFFALYILSLLTFQELLY